MILLWHNLAFACLRFIRTVGRNFARKLYVIISTTSKQRSLYTCLHWGGWGGPGSANRASFGLARSKSTFIGFLGGVELTFFRVNLDNCKYPTRPALVH